MRHSKSTLFIIVAVICVIAAVIIALLYLNMSGVTAEVHLSQEVSSNPNGESGDDNNSAEKNSPVFAELTPQNVQSVIKTINEPESYSCTYSVENFWSNGSSKSDINLYAKDNIFHVLISAGNSTRNIIMSDKNYYIWYTGSPEYYSGMIGDALTDKEIKPAVQMSGLYSSLLDADPGDILETSYQKFDNTYCIYASVLDKSSGYRNEYYISLDTGLLQKYEIFEDGTLTYRLIQTDSKLYSPPNEFFVLPDGTLVN